MSILSDEETRISFSEEGLTDEIVAYAFRPNSDGSITIEAGIHVYGPNGETWKKEEIKIRLEADDKPSRLWSRQKRLMK